MDPKEYHQEEIERADEGKTCTICAVLLKTKESETERSPEDGRYGPVQQSHDYTGIIHHQPDYTALVHSSLSCCICRIIVQSLET